MVLLTLGFALSLSLSAPTVDSSRAELRRTHHVIAPPPVYVGEPKILAAIAGLPRCMGTPDVETGREWDCPVIDVTDCVGNTQAQMVGAAMSPRAASFACRGQGLRNNTAQDATPVTFNWPVDVDTVRYNYFQYNFADGSSRPASCAIANAAPANEPNEFQTIAIIGDAGGWGEFATSLEIVGDLMLMAPNGTRVSAKGLTYSGPSLEVNNGPILLTVHLEPFTTEGELLQGGVYPNHCQVNFPLTTHRLRLLFNGGVSFDGLRDLTPDRTDLFVVADADGQTLPVDAVLGLADLGNTMPQTQCDKDAYAGDGDNYVDICLNISPDTPAPASVHVRCVEGAMMTAPKGLRYPCSPHTVDVTNEAY